ncbi:MAG: UPF0175 family protein [Deltaproteobacteria bacterium]|nr:UPF0175 family protein [Deltaproteobacteria bacterium]
MAAAPPRWHARGRWPRHHLTIEYGDDVLLSVGLSAEQFAQEAKFLLAARLYELGRLTAGQAAGLAAIGRVEFFGRLAAVGVNMVNLRPEDADDEIRFGLEVTGSLGLLLRARTLGLIPAVRPLIERAVAAGVGYDAELIRRVLASVGE